MTQVKPPARRTAGEVAVEFELTPEGAALLHANEPWSLFYKCLVAARLHQDAIRLAAYALPKKASIWWGALCLWNTTRPTPPAQVEEILKLTVAWLKESSEENRRAIEEAGNKLAFAKPAGSLALAVFTSGGSISKRGLPEVEPAPDLTAQSIALLVGMLARQHKTRLNQFLSLVPAVATGKVSFGAGMDIQSAVAKAPIKPRVIDESVGSLSESLSETSSQSEPRPRPNPVDDAWEALPRTPSSGKKPQSPKQSSADESIGQNSLDEFL